MPRAKASKKRKQKAMKIHCEMSELLTARVPEMANMQREQAVAEEMRTARRPAFSMKK